MAHSYKVTKQKETKKSIWSRLFGCGSKQNTTDDDSTPFMASQVNNSAQRGNYQRQQSAVSGQQGRQPSTYATYGAHDARGHPRAASAVDADPQTRTPDDGIYRKKSSSAFSSSTQNTPGDVKSVKNNRDTHDHTKLPPLSSPARGPTNNTTPDRQPRAPVPLVSSHQNVPGAGRPAAGPKQTRLQSRTTHQENRPPNSNMPTKYSDSDSSFSKDNNGTGKLPQIFAPRQTMASTDDTCEKCTRSLNRRNRLRCGHSFCTKCFPSHSMCPDCAKSHSGSKQHSGSNGKPTTNTPRQQPSVSSDEEDDCVICMCQITHLKQLPCGHKFCVECIDESFKQCGPKCPCCGHLCGAIKGNQPPGRMIVKPSPIQLKGYEGSGAIEIQYSIPSGIQTDQHPHPGQPFTGTHRYAYLPNNAEGKEVCHLLRRAFDDGLVFTVGQSVTTGKDNVVIWNDIHHKTSPHGPYGYPDPNYLSRVKKELRAKGITASPPVVKKNHALPVNSSTANGDHKPRRENATRKQAKPDAAGGWSNTVVNGIQQPFAKPNSQWSTPDLKKDNKAMLVDTCPIEEPVWKFIEKYHKADLRNICGKGVKFTYSAVVHQLEVESTNGQSITVVSDNIKKLCERILLDFADNTVLLPHGVNAGAFAKDLAEGNGCIYFVDAKQHKHIAGPKQNVSIVQNLIHDIVLDDQNALAHQSTAPLTSALNPFKTITPGGIHIEIYCGNLLNEKVDAIVNPANSYLSHGGGAAKAIADAAGPRLLRECRDYIKQNGGLSITQVMHTTAGNMNAPIQYVIHACGPPADMFSNDVELYSAIFDTFENCLEYANDSLNVTSVAIPAISSGVYGVPRQTVAEAAREAVLKFDKKFELTHPQSRGSLHRYVNHIHFVNIDAEATVAFIEAFKQDRPVSRPHSRRRSRSVDRPPAKQGHQQQPSQLNQPFFVKLTQGATAAAGTTNRNCLADVNSGLPVSPLNITPVKTSIESSI